MKYKENKAITLIALVVTIIILLILAGATIGFAVNGTGLFEKAANATEQYNNKVQQEEVELAKVSNELDKHINSDSGENLVTITDYEITCDSITQAIRGYRFEDSNHQFNVLGKKEDNTEEEKQYTVEIVNYYDDMHYSLESEETSKTIELGDSSEENKMLIVKYYKNLTIDEGVTLTAKKVNNKCYKKGMYVCVMGTLTNNGEISMTKRGTYGVEGENVYLWKNADDTYEYIPAIGASGLPAKQHSGSFLSAEDGNNGTGRQTGSGGRGSGFAVGGAVYNLAKTGDGTAYSGGAGTGAFGCAYSRTINQPTVSVYKGGDGSGWNPDGVTSRMLSGGAGNLQGDPYFSNVGGTLVKDGNGTGGLLVIYTNNLTGNGRITAEGSTAPIYSGSYSNSYVNGHCGGSSGGGSINIFYRNNSFEGTYSANGGIRTTMPNYTLNGSNPGEGGAGGNGTVTLTQV